MTKVFAKRRQLPLLPSKSSNQKKVPKVEAEKTLPKRPLTTDEKVHNYLNLFGPIAQREMRDYKIPASITLAQGLLESGLGRPLGRRSQQPFWDQMPPRLGRRENLPRR